MTRIAFAAALALLACSVGAARAAADDSADLEAQLAAAQARLEQAANEIADISTRLGEPMMQRMIIRGPQAPPPLIGVALDPGSGQEGARVLAVSPGGPAAAAGVRQGDVIVSVNGEKLPGREQPVKLEVLRAGKTLALAVTPRVLQFDAAAFAATEPFTAALPLPPMPEMPPYGRDVLIHGGARGILAGLEFVTLNPGLGEYFGTDKGVLVVRAPKSGALQLLEGDVIQSIGGREPRSGAHATRILASYQPGESVSIKVLRKRSTVDLGAKLPE